MPGGFPLGLELCNAQNGSISAGGTQGTTVTLAGSDNTKSGYTQLIASTTYDACFIMVLLQHSGGSGVAASAALDIAVGAGGSEKVILPDLMSQAMGAGALTGLPVTCYAFPISIPAGTRISAAVQCTNHAGAFIACSVILFDGAFTQGEGYAGVDAVGWVSGTTLGASVNPGVSINTKGSYTQLVASSANDYCGFVLGLDTQNVITANTGWLLDIAVGAAASEKIIVPDMAIWGYGTACNNGINPRNTPFIPIAIPAGTRISARCACQGASVLLGVTLYGVYQ